MCGICGYVSDNKYDVKLIDGMTMTMRHRGPDRQDTVHMKLGGKQCAFGHCRLSIIDITDAGNQPMWSNNAENGCYVCMSRHLTGKPIETKSRWAEDKQCCIVFNGEIYNYRELRREILADGGASFHSDSDTEVLLQGYMKWGKQVVNRLNGMFAFAIYDGRTEEIFLARDRFGKKPLYYYCKNGTFIFASELKPILLFPDITLNENTDVLAKYLRLGYFPDPETVFKQVKKLPPGHCATYRGGGIQVEPYWDLVRMAGWHSSTLLTDYEEAKNIMEGAIWNAVERRLASDVPLGAFLSGGIDSTLVAAMAQKLTDGGIATFTMGFESPDYDEARVARRISSHIGSRHQEHYVTDHDLGSIIESIPHYFDEPFGDTSMLPSMILSKMARGSITVALSGDGGDEVFGGYPQYLKEHYAQYFDVLGGMMGKILPDAVIRRFPRSVRRVVSNRDKRAKTQFALDEEIQFYRGLVLGDSAPPVFLVEDKMVGIRDWQFRRMLLDMKTTLPGDMLHKVDRASMSASLEVRSPLLDYEVAELSFRMPQKFKIHRGVRKRMLRDIAYKYVPREIIDLPKKGFCVPYEAWMRTSLRERLSDYTEKGFLVKQGLFSPTACCRLVDEFLGGNNGNANVCWNFLMYQMWWEYYRKKRSEK